MSVTLSIDSLLGGLLFPAALLGVAFVAPAWVRPGSSSVETSLGPACLVVGVLVFLVVSRPWRLLARRGTYAAA